jgi:catechol 2,3-dioxygenase-like lactoylglutathione lyase family enzyme
MASRYLGLGHVALRSKRYDVMYDFYVNQLGGREVFHLNQDSLPQGKGDERIWLTYICFGNGQYVEMFTDSYEGANEFATASFVSLCLEVGNMVLALKAFEAQGIKIYSAPNGYELAAPFAQYGPDECGTLRAYIRDPEGNWIELQQFTPKSMQIVCV